MTITRMVSEMSSAELYFWEQLQMREFIGDERQDYRAALIRHTTMEFAGRTLGEGTEVSPFDLMPYYQNNEQPIELTAEQIADKVDVAMNAIIGIQQAKEEAKK